MFSFETLDRIADNVNLVFGVFVLAWSWVVYKRTTRGGWFGNAVTLASVAIVYGVQWLDHRLHLWEVARLDYSTHTALYTALAVSLWQIDRRAGIGGVALGVAYAALMRYQGYHSVGDIVTTAVVLIALAMGCWLLITKLARRNPATRPPAPEPGAAPG